MPNQAIITFEVSGRSPRARLVLADGEALTTTSIAVLKAIGIEEGDVTAPAVLLDQIAQFEPTAARKRALAILNYRERSVAELRDRLLRDGFSQHTLEPLLERLADLELVNDSRFARLYVRSKLAAGWGTTRIANGLRQSGVEDEILATALVGEATDGEYERALTFALRKRPTSAAAAKRVADSLARRGFSFDIARRASQEALDSVPDTS